MSPACVTNEYPDSGVISNAVCEISTFSKDKSFRRKLTFYATRRIESCDQIIVDWNPSDPLQSEFHVSNEHCFNNNSAKVIDSYMQFPELNERPQLFFRDNNVKNEVSDSTRRFCSSRSFLDLLQQCSSEAPKLYKRFFTQKRITPLTGEGRDLNA